MCITHAKILVYISFRKIIYVSLIMLELSNEKEFYKEKG